MKFSTLAEDSRFERVPPPEPKRGCSDIPDEQFIKGGVNTDGFLITPDTAAKRIGICGACKYHQYKDGEKRIGLRCSLQKCYTNGKGRFLAIACRAGEWE